MNPGLFGGVSILLVLALVATVAGCSAAYRDPETPHQEVRRLAQAYRDCVNDQATRLMHSADLSAQSVATTAIDRCNAPWDAFTDAAEQAYALHSHNVSLAHRAAMADGFRLNMQLERQIKQTMQAAGARTTVPAGD